MKKADVIKTIKNNLEKMKEYVECYDFDKARAIDQAYGFLQGVEMVTNCDKYFDELTEIWSEWQRLMMWEVTQGTKEPEWKKRIREEKEAREAAQEEETAETIEEETEEETTTEETQEETTEENESQEGENKMQILVNDMKVRQMCIDENYYTCGDNTAYSHMLFEMCSEAHTVAEVKAIAEDIAAHSDLETKMDSYGVNEDQMILIIAENIINECSYISLGIF